jgi:hypothetical protein
METRRGRPRSLRRELADQSYRDRDRSPTIRTLVDRSKSSSVVYELMKLIAAEQGCDPGDVTTDDIRKRFPKYVRRRPRMILLRHFAVLEGDPKLPKVLAAFHDLHAWRTAREGEALIKRLLA